MIQKLFIDRSVEDAPMTRDMVRRIKGAAPVVVDGPDFVQKVVRLEPDPVSAGKQVLFLTRNRGPFIKACPGTRSYLCCGYRILNIAHYCSMDCAYCILQAYFDPPFLQYFVNVEQLDAELQSAFTAPEPPFHRIGTGEFTDSLIWENWTHGAADLIRRFSRQDRIVLELKTKTVHVSRFEALDHNRKTIISWSLNPPEVIARQERATARLADRLRAAARCGSWGYPLAFHFDPLLLFDGWEKQYEDTVASLFRTVSAQDVVWISLGSFRFMPQLKPIVSRRFSRSKIIYGEFIRGLDGKMRYFKPLRIQLYKRMVEWIRRWAPDVRIYLCMEDEEVWEKSIGFIPDQENSISRLLDKAAAKHCGITLSDKAAYVRRET